MALVCSQVFDFEPTTPTADADISWSLPDNSLLAQQDLTVPHTTLQQYFDNSISINTTTGTNVGVVSSLSQFSCPYCSYTSNRRVNLQTHIRRHTGEKPYVCCYCRKRFVSKAELNIHIKIHTGERMFDCSFCSYKSAQRHCLRMHMMRKHAQQLFTPLT